MRWDALQLSRCDALEEEKVVQRRLVESPFAGECLAIVRESAEEVLLVHAGGEGALERVLQRAVFFSSVMAEDGEAGTESSEVAGFERARVGRSVEAKCRHSAVGPSLRSLVSIPSSETAACG